MTKTVLVEVIQEHRALGGGRKFHYYPMLKMFSAGVVIALYNEGYLTEEWNFTSKFFEVACSTPDVEEGRKA